MRMAMPEALAHVHCICMLTAAAVVQLVLWSLWGFGMSVGQACFALRVVWLGVVLLMAGPLGHTRPPGHCRGLGTRARQLRGVPASKIERCKQCNSFVSFTFIEY